MDASKKRRRQQSTRKVNFNTRKHGLLKKFNELKTLCDLTSCCLIMYDPKENQLKAYPEDDAECQRIVQRYKGTSREDRLKHNDNVIGLLNEKKKKCEAELAKLQSDKYPAWDSSLDNMGLEELKDVAHKLDSLLECVWIKDEEANSQVQILQGTGQFIGKPLNFQPSDHACPSSYQPSEWMDVDCFPNASMVMAPPNMNSQTSSNCFTGGSAIVSPLDQQMGWANSNYDGSTVMMGPLDIQDYLPLTQEFEWNSDSTSDATVDGVGKSIDWAKEPLDFDFEPLDNKDRLLADAPAKKMMSGSGSGNQNDEGALEWIKQYLEVETSDMSCDMVTGFSDQQLFDIWVA